MWCEDARKINVFMDGGSQSIQMSSLNEYAKSFGHVIASVIQNKNANVKDPMDAKFHKSCIQNMGEYFYA